MSDALNMNRELIKAKKKLEKARGQADEAWKEMQALMKQANLEHKMTFGEIAAAVGVTKARVYQVVTGKRGPVKTKKAQAEAEAATVDA